MLDRLALAGIADRPAAGLPYGTLKRIELARALAAEPELLMLDEPASGLSHEEVDELAGVIEDVRADMTVLLVEHHMGMVMRLSDTSSCSTSAGWSRPARRRRCARIPAVLAAYLGTPA